ncbi:MAG: class I mannose-6-phosphate isomerase [Treponema sp.]|nr:class I mannose-6-phosphate isomerase [Treponema sp.]
MVSDTLLLPLLPNRVRRNYRGGAGIEKLQAGDTAKEYSDGDKPEEWVASLVNARNPGLTPVENEGLSRCAINGQPLLTELLRSKPEFYLGKDWYDSHGLDLGFLLKILDSSMRLHVQAHPTAAFARKYLGSSYGKFECYYILSIREGREGYIRLGFQHLPSKGEWRRIIEEQDIQAMDACFEKIPVKAGDVWYIPGGVPHAIGENTLMLEIMEPSDLVVRCEFEREGIVVPPEARFMGRDLDFCLGVFDYSEQSVDDVRRTYRLFPKPLGAGGNGSVFEELAAPPAAPFVVQRLSLKPGPPMAIDNGSFCAAIASRGRVTIHAGGEETILKQGQSLFIAAAAKHLEVSSPGQAELCLVRP